MEQVLTIGDNTNHGEIKSFEIIDSDMYAKCSRGIFNIKELTVLLPTEKITTNNDNLSRDAIYWKEQAHIHELNYKIVLQRLKELQKSMGNIPIDQLKERL